MISILNKFVLTNFKSLLKEYNILGEIMSFWKIDVKSCGILELISSLPKESVLCCFFVEYLLVVGFSVWFCEDYFITLCFCSHSSMWNEHFNWFLTRRPVSGFVEAKYQQVFQNVQRVSGSQLLCQLCRFRDLLWNQLVKVLCYFAALAMQLVYRDTFY